MPSVPELKQFLCDGGVVPIANIGDMGCASPSRAIQVAITRPERLPCINASDFGGGPNWPPLMPLAIAA